MPDNGELHVVFGTGPIGMSVVDALVKRGKRVRMVNRSGRANVPEGVEVVGGDAADRAQTREATAGSSVVYFALNPPYDKWPELFPPLQEAVVEGAAAGAKLVAVENLYMYGPTDGRPLTEDLPHAAETRKGSVRARMSEELMEAHKSGRVRVTTGRASDFFGPRVLVSSEKPLSTHSGELAVATRPHSDEQPIIFSNRSPKVRAAILHATCIPRRAENRRG